MAKRSALLWALLLTLSVAIVLPATGASGAGGDPRESGPPDNSSPSRQAIPQDTATSSRKGPVSAGAGSPNIVDPIVSNTDPALKNSAAGGSEAGAALNPVTPRSIVVDGFNGGWGTNAPIFTSSDGGLTFSRNLSIPVPPGRVTQATVPFNCPCDQTFDFGNDGLLYGTFLLNGSAGTIVTGNTNNPTSAAAWQWRGNPVQLTDNAVNHADDQPWLITNNDPVTTSQTNTYVGYDDFTAANSRVAVSLGATPPNFTRDTVMRNFGGGQASNPGTRINRGANGVMWGIIGQTNSSALPKVGHYQIERSIDGGQTWTAPAVINTLWDDNPNTTNSKFGGVNALLGSVDAIAGDPTDPNIAYIAFGVHAGSSGIANQIQLARLNLSIPAFDRTPILVSTGAAANDAALPGVTVTSDGSIFVLYTTHDGTSGGFPQFSAHLHRLSDNGTNFVDAGDTVLEQFLSPSTNNAGDPRQRVLGDFQQIKSVGNIVYGSFAGNRVPFNNNAGLSVIDPIYFQLHSTLLASSTTITSSQDPATPGTPVTFTATVTGVPGQTNPTGTVTFRDGATVLSTSTIDQVTGQTSFTTSTLSFGSHTITATYSGDGNYNGSQGSLVQVIGCDHNISGNQTKLGLSGGSWCVVNANVNGSISASTGTTAIILNSTVSGGITAQNGARFMLCGSTVGSTVNVSGASGFVLVGDPGDDACNGNNIGGDIVLSANRSGAEIGHNILNHGGIYLSGTSGVGPFPEDAAPEIEANQLTSIISCSGNTPTPTNDGQPNTGGTRAGQCVGL